MTAREPSALGIVRAGFGSIAEVGDGAGWAWAEGSVIATAWDNWLSNCFSICVAVEVKLPARGVERAELSTWEVGDWRGSSDCDVGRTVSVLDRLCGRLDSGDMFQSDSSVVELIGTAIIITAPRP